MKFKENIKTKYRAGMCSLIISEVTMDDNGDYVCKATNDADQVTTEATVHVKCEKIILLHSLHACLFCRLLLLFFVLKNLFFFFGKKSFMSTIIVSIIFLLFFF